MSEKTLIIYDLNGTLISNPITGFYAIPKGIPYLEVEVPEGKYVKSVNVETKEAVYGDIPLTETEILRNKISILEQNNQELREELTQIQTSIASLTSLITVTLEEK